MTANEIVSLGQACFEYRVARGPSTLVGPFTLRVERGEMTAVVGPSGSGKSTLLGMLAGILQPTSGERRASYELTKSPTAFVLQSHAVHPYLSAWENVAAAWGHPTPRQRRRATEVLRAFGLEDVAEKRAQNLSGGQQQRVAIARAYASDSPLIVADEPTGSLDPANASAVLDALSASAKRGRSVVIATHDSRVVARCSGTYDVAQQGLKIVN